MAQQQNDSLNQMPTSENSYMNDVTGKSFPQNGNNLDPTKNVSNMNEPQKGKPSGPNGNSAAAAGPVGMPPAHNDASGMHLGPYGHPMQHHHMPPEIDQQQQPLEHMYNPQAPYGRYHDPNMPPMDMYGRYHPGGLEMKIPPNRPPPQRYPQQQPQTSASNQQPQQSYSAHPSHAPHTGEQAAQEQTQQPPNPIGQTPTLNSLLQSHQTAGPPQPHHHRYPNSYEQQSSQQPAYSAQTWNPSAAPQQRPYSPQMGQQAYRPPPPNANAARIHPSMGSYPPPPPQQNQSGQLGPAGAMQYSPYPQRYPTPPGNVATGTNHRPAYPASHQYPPDQSRPWPPPTGPTTQTTHGHAPHQHPPSPQHHVTAQSPVHAPSPSPQPPQPSNSPHQEICQNSNETNAPGATTNTPNSMTMRPTPSPTGSSGSRSMSPAVPQNHRPPYQHPGEQQPMDPNAQQQRSPMIPNAQSASDFYEKRNLQGNYPTPPSPHKYPPPPQATGPNAMPPQGMPPYGSQSQQFPQGNYPARPQYPSNYGQVNGPANAPHVPNQNQYGRPMPNQTQFPQGNYPTPPTPHMHGAYKGGTVNGPAPNTAPGSPRPLNHLKQHLLHKGGYGNQSPTSPQSFVNGPGMHQPMGPPQMQAPSRMQAPGSMGPPFSPHHNSQVGNTHQGGIIPLPESQDNGISSGSSASSQHPVTSIITTGPDGTTIDEASQHSTISNASAASDPSDPQCSTPKRKGEPYNQSHLASAGSTTTMHEDFEMGSPPWPRTPASPVFNSHTEPTPHRSSSKQKSDSLCKLYEMDDNPERRPFLDKLLSFMEERRTPITACPAISKQPLDLYRLYTSVKERGGFLDVCKVTKSKLWKDVASILGIGASSSAAYTLRKHYTKNLLPFECQFDRGGIDPLPLIQQVESNSKKKTPKPASAPSPDANHKGSSNSQDSFQAQIQSPPGSSSASMDSFNAYPPPPQQQPQQQQQQQQQHQQQQTTGPSVPVPPNAYPQPNAAGKSATSTPQYPVEQQPYGPPAQQPPFQQPQQGQFAAPNRYPPYGDAPDARYNQHQPPPPPTVQQSATQAPPPSQAPSGPPLPNAPPSQYPQGPPPQQFEYRQQEPPQSRRHPDFAKESQYSPAPAPYNQRPQLYPNWQGNASPSHYNRQYSQAPQQWANQRLPGPPVMGAPVQNSQWEQQRYPPQTTHPPYPGNQVQPPQWTGMNQSQLSNVPAIRPPQRPGQIPGKNIPGPMPPPQLAKQTQVAPFPSASPAKRDIVFPSDSVEAVTPLLYRRKRLTKTDIGQTDMWRIFMCLQSGLLSESTWALDVLNILLFDDSSIQWFSLAYLPGLLNMLLDHFQKSLTDMFDSKKFSGRPAKPLLKAENKRILSKNDVVDGNSNDEDREEEDDGLLKDCKEFFDLGQVTKQPNPNERLIVFHSMTDYTMCSRKGVPVRIKEADDDIFVLDSKRNWDIHADIDQQINTDSDDDIWSYGHIEPDPYTHIIDPFKGEFVNIPFAKYIKSSDRKRKASADETNEKKTITNDAPKSANGDSKKSSVNSPNPSVKEEKIDDTNDEPKVVDITDADKAEAVEKAKDVKSEPMETDENETTAAATKKGDDSMSSKNSESSEPSKKEQSPVMDSDCREVDMELEKLSNGSQSNDATANAKESESKKSDNTTNTFDVKKTIQDPAETLKRRRISDFEDECYARDEASLYLISESQDTVARRCLSISNILRNLTFVPGNETVFANSETFLAILGRILLLHHKHPVRTQTIRNYDREDDNDFSDSCSSLQGENEWWWDYLIQLRENMMVAVANIAGHMQLANYDEIIARPCLDGLLHWAICPSAHGQDPFPSSGPTSLLSPQRLALEALCKICVTDANVDLVIATPPFSRLENLCSVLTRHLCRNEDQVLREFSVNLLHYLASAESSMARTVALQSPCISYLVAFIEQAEQTALGIANQHGINYLRENPDSMGTSLDMLRRTAGTLLHLARHPDNRPLFLQQEQRLLGLVMSHILDQQVALIISRVLFQVSRGGGACESPVKKVKRRPLPQNAATKLVPSTESSIPVS